MTEPMLAVSQDPVSWLLNNPKLLLIVFPAAIWLINQIQAAARARQAGRAAEAGAGQDDPEAERTRRVREEIRNAWQGASTDPAEAERTRRVQEEVRRKIAERRGERPPQPAASPRIDASLAPPARAVVPPRIVQQPAAAVAVAPPAPSSFPSAQPPAVAELLMELHDRSEVRRAIVLREVLGPPVALR